MRGKITTLWLYFWVYISHSFRVAWMGLWSLHQFKMYLSKIPNRKVSSLLYILYLDQLYVVWWLMCLKLVLIMLTYMHECQTGTVEKYWTTYHVYEQVLRQRSLTTLETLKMLVAYASRIHIIKFWNFKTSTLKTINNIDMLADMHWDCFWRKPTYISGYMH